MVGRCGRVRPCGSDSTAALPDALAWNHWRNAKPVGGSWLAMRVSRRVVSGWTGAHRRQAASHGYVNSSHALRYWINAKPVGASLLAKAMHQTTSLQQIDCIREQARSHLTLVTPASLDDHKPVGGSWLAISLFAQAPGNRTTAHNPAGVRFSRVSSPPWAWMQARAMASPRPNPPPCVESVPLWLSCTNGSKTCVSQA